eukprot:CAMPEP_0173112644 /NCGR_PEP_ID=MMETSP1102-20130122/46203_1 /TAXON_ID=49646 /ORGANISM="Geminigera sp., Strain Caron Lab Isolate" /LENGTH=146 /DNA_ID=CAMNT_0014013879 /DNA_START=9 /DNA_END=445 /DNA_ORIENTATION=+
MATVQEALSNAIVRLNEPIARSNEASTTHDLAGMEGLASTVERLFFLQTHLIEWAQSALVVQALGAQDGSECPAPASLQDLAAARSVGAARSGAAAASPGAELVLQRAVNSILFRGPSHDLPAVAARVPRLAQTFLSWSVGWTEPA